MIECTLNNGRKVNVKYMMINATYGGLFEGDPNNPQISKMLLDGVKRSYQKSWGERPVLIEDAVIPLHSTTIYLWMDSSSIEPMEMGSELVYIFFTELDMNKSIQTIIKDAIKDINWNAHAKDYVF